MVEHVGIQLGAYRLLRYLGSGNFAHAYLGEHISQSTRVAIKVMKVQLSPGDEERFLNDAQTFANLKHPNLIHILDFAIESNTPFLVMDFATNGNLRPRYIKGVPLSPAVILPIVKQITAALQYAHEQNLIHRNIKPTNLLLGPDDEVLLSDIGIPTLLDNPLYLKYLESNDSIAYAAPEQLRGRPLPASDQYSLGIIVYEWLTGDRPFHGESPIEIANQHLFVPPQPLREKVPALLPDIEEVVMIALAKDPRQRFASVKAFATALEQACIRRATPLPTSTPGLLVSLPTKIPPGLPQVSIPPPASALTYSGSPSAMHTSIQPISLTSDATALADTSTPAQTDAHANHKRSLSRRSMLAAIVGAAIVVGGGVTALALEQGTKRFSGAHGLIARHTPPHVPVPTHTPTPVSTPSPLGTTFYAFHGHREVVKSVSWSPLDGRRIASGSFDFTAQVWDALNGNDVLQYIHHTDGVKTLAWSPDGTRICTGSQDKTVRVWNALTGSDVLAPYTGHTKEVRTVAWSPDSASIASGSQDKTVQVWNATTGDTLFTYRGHTDQVINVAWSPEGTRIASASFDGTVQIWTVTIQGNSYIYTYRGHSPFGVRGVAWSPDGKLIASGGNDGLVQLWNASTGQTIRIFKGHTKEVQTVAWSRDGKYIASASFDSTVKIWDVSTGHNSFTYKLHTAPVWAIAWSPDGKLIASGSEDRTVQIWQAV